VPNTKSAKKKMRVEKRKTLRNKMVVSAMKTYVKNAEEAIESKDREVAEKAICTAASKLDKAAVKGVIHYNKAARKKSRLMKHYNAMIAAGTAEKA